MSLYHGGWGYHAWVFLPKFCINTADMGRQIQHSVLPGFFYFCLEKTDYGFLQSRANSTIAKIRRNKQCHIRAHNLCVHTAHDRYIQTPTWSPGQWCVIGTGRKKNIRLPDFFLRVGGGGGRRGEEDQQPEPQGEEKTGEWGLSSGGGSKKEACRLQFLCFSDKLARYLWQYKPSAAFFYAFRYLYDKETNWTLALISNDDLEGEYTFSHRSPQGKCAKEIFWPGKTLNVKINEQTRLRIRHKKFDKSYNIFLLPIDSNLLHRAGHFRHFLYSFTNKKWYFGIFYQVNNLFLHQSYLKSPTPSQISLIKNATNHFLFFAPSALID